MRRTIPMSSSVSQDVLKLDVPIRSLRSPGAIRRLLSDQSQAMKESFDVEMTIGEPRATIIALSLVSVCVRSRNWALPPSHLVLNPTCFTKPRYRTSAARCRHSRRTCPIMRRSRHQYRRP